MPERIRAAGFDARSRIGHVSGRLFQNGFAHSVFSLLGFRQGDAAEDFVEPAFFGVQFFDRPTFARGELPDGARQLAALAFLCAIGAQRERRFAQHRTRISPTARNLTNFCRTARSSRPRPHRDRAGVFRALPQFLRRAIGHDLAAIDDDRARTGRLDLLENVGRKNDRLRSRPSCGSGCALRVFGWDRGHRSAHPGSGLRDRE